MDGIWMYLSIPVIFSIIGYFTNKMCILFATWPIEFIGLWKPYIGWQGIIPARSAEIGGDLVTVFADKLLDVRELFSKIEAERVVQELEPRMMEMIEDVIDSLMMERSPQLWESLPRRVKQRIYGEAKKKAPAIIHEMVGNISENIEEVFDIEQMLGEVFINNPAMLVDIMKRIGHKEFTWIYNSGGVLGGIFGAIQAVVWAVYPEPWVLIAGGILVGGFTNYLAITTIFEPAEPKQIGPFKILGKQFGPWIAQGLFIKRRADVAVDIGMFMSAEIMTPEKITEAFLKGPASDKLIAMIDAQVKDILDKEIGLAKPFVTLTLGTQRFISIRESVADKVVEKMPIAMDQIHDYTEESLDIKNFLQEKMKLLTAEEFSAMLRPIFEADEWKLVLLGCVVGGAIGYAQISFYT